MTVGGQLQLETSGRKPLCPPDPTYKTVSRSDKLLVPILDSAKILADSTI